MTENYLTKEDGTEDRIIAMLVAVGIFSLTFSFLYVIDFYPESPEKARATLLSVATSTIETEVVAVVPPPDIESVPELESEPEPVRTPAVAPNRTLQSGSSLPTKIIIDELDKEVAVLNPQSIAIADLDHALLSGVVRHPESADFKEDGTMFLFGHSSYLPHVINKNFQAFNGIQNLSWGDTIRVQSGTMEYVYRVDKVYQVKASDAEVEIVRGEPRLTLATCNTFGSKDDRYIVEAELVDSFALRI